MAELNAWDVVDANNNAAPPDGWPENTMQYSEVNDAGRQVQGSVRRFFGDVNGSLDAGGVADAYTLTLNAAYAAYFDGMYLACSIPVVNTGASTLNVNGLGVQSIVLPDGSALSGGEFAVGGIYEFRYDGTNFQLQGALSASISPTQGTFTNSATPDLIDTNVALRVGAADPDTAAHLELGPSAIQSKSDATTASQLNLQNAGGVVRVPTDTVGAMAIGANFNSPTIPLGASASADLNFWAQSNTAGDQVGFGCYVADGVRNQRFFFGQHDNDVWGLSGTGSTGSPNFVVQYGGEDLIRAVPNGGVTLYQNDLIRYSQTSFGFRCVADGNSDTEDLEIEFSRQNLTTRASLGFDSSSLFAIRNEIDSGQIACYGRDSGSLLSPIWVGDPDGALTFYHDGIQVAGTQDRTATAASTAMFITDSVSNSFPVGFNVIPGRTITTNQTLDGDFIGRMWEKTAGGAISITLPNDADIPSGATIMVANEDTENISINQGTGVTLRWFDGSTSGGATGNRTLASGGVVSIRKSNSTEFYIWGNGLS